MWLLPCAHALRTHTGSGLLRTRSLCSHTRPSVCLWKTGFLSERGDLLICWFLQYLSLSAINCRMLQNLRERQGSKIYKLLGERMPNWQIVSETIFVLPPPLLLFPGHKDQFWRENWIPFLAHTFLDIKYESKTVKFLHLLKDWLWWEGDAVGNACWPGHLLSRALGPPGALGLAAPRLCLHSVRVLCESGLRGLGVTFGVMSI